MQLYVCANNQEILRGVLNPADPHRGWDSFLKIHNTGEVHTAQERWVSYTSWSLDIQHTDRIAEQKRRIQRYKDDMSDTSDSSLDSSRIAGLVSRDGSCSSFTDSDEAPPHWDFNRWLAMRESVRQPNRGRAPPEYWARWSAQRRAEVLLAERQADVHWNQGQGPDEEVPLPNSNRTPGADTHGRAFSSDEDGDGPCVPIQHFTRYFRSCFGKRNEEQDDLMVVQALREHADVPPICEVCNTPCKMHARCNFCRLGPVMHHGRCCWWNPGQRRRRAHEARVASDADWLEQNMRWHDNAQQEYEERDAW